MCRWWHVRTFTGVGGFLRNDAAIGGVEYITNNTVVNGIAWIDVQFVWLTVRWCEAVAFVGGNSDVSVITSKIVAFNVSIAAVSRILFSSTLRGMM